MKVRNVNELKDVIKKKIIEIDRKSVDGIEVIMEGGIRRGYFTIDLCYNCDIYIDLPEIFYLSVNDMDISELKERIVNDILFDVRPELMKIFKKNIKIDVKLPKFVKCVSELIENVFVEIEVNDDLEMEIKEYFERKGILVLDNVKNIINKLIDDIDLELLAGRLIFEFYYEEEFVYDDKTKKELIEFISENIIDEINKRFIKEIKLSEVIYDSIPDILANFGYRKDEFFHYNYHKTLAFPIEEMEDFLSKIEFEFRVIYDSIKMINRNGIIIIPIHNKDSECQFDELCEFRIKIDDEEFYVYRYLFTKWEYRKRYGEFYFRVFKERKEFNELVSLIE